MWSKRHGSIRKLPSLLEGEVLAEEDSGTESWGMSEGMASTLSISSSRGLRGSMQREARVRARSRGSMQMECLFFCFLLESWVCSWDSRHIEWRVLAEVGISRAPSYKESLERGASPSSGRTGEDGRGQAQEPRKEGEEAREEEPPEPAENINRNLKFTLLLTYKGFELQ